MLIRVFIFAGVLLLANASQAQSASASPSLEQRVADLEAYVNNAARGSDSASAKSNSNISGPGPGHNGWMMTASALVLFMTGWSGAPHAAVRMLAWPSRRECLLVVLAAVIWTAYNAGYANFLAYLPSYLVTRGHSGGIADLVVTMATWGNLPAILLGGALAVIFPSVFVLGAH